MSQGTVPIPKRMTPRENSDTMDERKVAIYDETAVPCQLMKVEDDHLVLHPLLPTKLFSSLRVSDSYKQTTWETASAKAWKRYGEVEDITLDYFTAWEEPFELYLYVKDGFVRVQGAVATTVPLDDLELPIEFDVNGLGFTIEWSDTNGWGIQRDTRHVMQYRGDSTLRKALNAESSVMRIPLGSKVGVEAVEDIDITMANSP